LQEPVQSNGTGVSDVIWAVSEGENVHMSANAKTERRMDFMLAIDTDGNPEVPLESWLLS
jgi:hypothetical protein